MKSLVTHWTLHHAGHLVIAIVVAWLAQTLLHVGVVAGAGFAVAVALLIETYEIVLLKSTSTAQWRDHVADLVTYLFIWPFVLAGARLWFWAGVSLALLAVLYAITLAWSKPGPKHAD